MLACLPEAEARAIVLESDRQPLTPHTLTDMNVVMEKIAEARRGGFAVAVQEAIQDEITIGGAVVYGNGRPLERCILPPPCMNGSSNPSWRR